MFTGQPEMQGGLLKTLDFKIYLGLLTEADGEQYRIYERQCSAPGAMLAFDIRGGEKAAFAFLNHLQLVKVAVSLGSTESLAQHPATMTHAGIPADVLADMGISEKLVRLSVGVENVRDLIADIEFALGVDDSELYGDVTFFSVFVFFYGLN